jgi:hypothetical protein
VKDKSIVMCIVIFLLLYSGSGPLGLLGYPGFNLHLVFLQAAFLCGSAAKDDLLVLVLFRSHRTTQYSL